MIFFFFLKTKFWLRILSFILTNVICVKIWPLRHKDNKDEVIFSFTQIRLANLSHCNHVNPQAYFGTNVGKIILFCFLKTVSLIWAYKTWLLFLSLPPEHTQKNGLDPTKLSGWIFYLFICPSWTKVGTHSNWMGNTIILYYNCAFFYLSNKNQ